MKLAPRTDHATRTALVTEWRDSGMTSNEFAASRGINAATLRGWKFRMVEAGEIANFEEPKAKAPKIKLQPVVTATPKIEIEPRAPARAHKALAKLARKVRAGLNNIMVVGPAGSGKTTLASQLAESMGLAFGVLSLSGGTNESHLFGRLAPDATGAWTYNEAPFVSIYRNGGVFLLDEMDAGDANVLVAANAALANGFLVVPATGERVERHPSTVIVAAANTYGSGADAIYVGRNALDAATLDRFACAVIEVDYDRDLEREIATEIAGEGAAQLLNILWSLRDKVQASRMRRIIGTRAVIAGAKLVASGDSVAEVVEALQLGWSSEEKRKVA